MTRQSVVVVEFENAIAAVEIAWQKDELNLVGRHIPYIKTTEGVHNCVVGHVVEMMGEHRGVERGVEFLSAFKTIYKVFARCAPPSGYFYKGYNLLFEIEVEV